MTIFKCKMCGGTIEFNQGDKIGTCDSCGTIQTLPRLDDDRRVNLYDRANHFRRNNDFDKAANIYEQILSEDNTDSEAYWSLVLCRYGIEYVEDPHTHKRVPTVNRAQFTSIYADEDYKSAIQYADESQKEIYEQEAKVIDDIQKGILAISQKEEPFDIFICYKETDNSGRRTIDSVLANDLYHQLIQEGFKVFFSRITLEDKLGTAYEPYIFAALNSAKVMVVLGTKSEYFNAVWVKNEWSRYLALVKQSHGNKILIPAYRDMDPYDLPEEFSHLQAQDMSKLGFMQDLIRGIKKLVNAENQKIPATETGNTNYINIEPLLERAFLFLEDGNFKDADEYLEKVLDQDPKCAQAYLGKLMIDLKVKKPKDLSSLENPFDNNNNYQKILRFGDANLTTKLKNITDAIIQKKHEKLLQLKYEEALKLLHEAEQTLKSVELYKAAASKFEDILDYKNSKELAEKALEKAELSRKHNIYEHAIEEMKINSIDNYENAINLLSSIQNYKDSEDLINICKDNCEKLKEDEIRRKELLIIEKKKKKKRMNIILLSGIVIAVFCVILVNVIIPEVKYNTANKCFESQDYQKAVSIYTELGNYKDCEDRLSVSVYKLAGVQYESGEYKEAYENYNSLKSIQSFKYRDVHTKMQMSGLLYATNLMERKDYNEARTILSKIGDYETSDELRHECNYELAKIDYNNGDYISCMDHYLQSGRPKNYGEADDFYIDAIYCRAKKFTSEKDYKNAISCLNKIEKYKDALELIDENKYLYVKSHKNGDDHYTWMYIKDLRQKNYKDVDSIYKDIYSWKATIIVNDDENDEKTSKSSVSKYSTWYCHISLSGGEPNEEITLKYVGTFPDGSTVPGQFDGKWKDGYTSWSNFWYNNPQYARQGTFKYTVFDGNGNVIGEKTVNITD